MAIKVSIIIPVYKVEKYIRRCIDSVVKQTYSGPIECILVDDCGPDDSLMICEDFVNSYVGHIEFRVIRHTENRGLSVARNTGTNAATGEYVYYLDSDDAIPDNSIDLLVSEVIKHHGIDIVMGTMCDDRHTEVYNLNCYKDHQYVTDNRWLQFNIFKCGKYIPVNATNKLIRRDLILYNNLYFETGIIHEDFCWIFYALKYIKSWAFVFDDTYIRYWNDDTIMTSLATKKDIEALNWYKITSGWCDSLYEPFVKLKVCKIMNIYFSKEIYKHVDGSVALIHKLLRVAKERRLFKLILVLHICNIFSLIPRSHKILNILSFIPLKLETNRINAKHFNQLF